MIVLGIAIVGRTKNKTKEKSMKITLLSVYSAILMIVSLNAQETKDFGDFIAPVSNPVYFESPFHTSEARLIHLHQELNGDVYTAAGKLPLNGELTLTALQLRYAVNDRFSIIATKDGYGRMKYDNSLETEDGFADLAIGFKYSPYINYEDQEIITLGLRFELPIGDGNMLQGRHDGIANPFLSFAKGFGDFHILGYQGFQIPFSQSANSTISHTSLHADYKIGNFYPLIEMNWRHVISSGDGGRYDTDVKALDLGKQDVNFINNNLSGLDIANLGTSDSEGNNYFNMAFGFRYKLTENLIFGAAYETPLSDSKDGLFRERYTFDLIMTF